MTADKTKRRLRVFEAFAGIGAQATALKRLGVEYEVVGISDWFIDAIICYDALHNNGEEIELPDIAEQRKYLSRFEFSRDSVHPIKSIDSINEETLCDLYRAHKRAKNFGSITQLNVADIPDCDLFVYSFPCQDLSTGGNNYGMRKDSGTRSSLLWAIEDILQQFHETNRLPQYLLLENVKTIKADTHRGDLQQWLDFLTSLGYQNSEIMLLNAADFGVPQDRERAFILSNLGDAPLNILPHIENSKKNRYGNRIADFIKTDYSNQVYKNEADIAQLNGTPSRLQMWDINGKEPEEINDHLLVRTITCNMDRTHTSALFRHEGPKGKTFRRLTIREAFLLMGFTEEEYQKTICLGYSYRKMNKLIGNSIVVNVLTAIFDAIIKSDSERWVSLERKGAKK